MHVLMLDKDVLGIILSHLDNRDLAHMAQTSKMCKCIVDELAPIQKLDLHGRIHLWFTEIIVQFIENAIFSREGQNDNRVIMFTWPVKYENGTLIGGAPILSLAFLDAPENIPENIPYKYKDPSVAICIYNTTQNDPSLLPSKQMYIALAPYVHIVETVLYEAPFIPVLQWIKALKNKHLAFQISKKIGSSLSFCDDAFPMDFVVAGANNKFNPMLHLKAIQYESGFLYRMEQLLSHFSTITKTRVLATNYTH